LVRRDGSGTRSLGAAGAAAAGLAGGLIAACTSGARNDSNCEPPPESCDQGSPQMMPVEDGGCLGAPVALPQVCATSVNRCGASAGLGVVCAFAPVGSVYVTMGSDNDVLTAPGWRFAEYVELASIPGDQAATQSESASCVQLACASPCPGVQAAYFPGPGCRLGSGNADE
jgi:hypothetical protein